MADKISCSNCGAPFHGFTACAADAPDLVKRRASANEKAARIWMQREGFILKTPGSFHSDICSGDAADAAEVFTIVAERLEMMARNYREAVKEAREYATTD